MGVGLFDLDFHAPRLPSDAHWHQDVKRVGLVVFAQQGRRRRIGQVDFHDVAVDLASMSSRLARMNPISIGSEP